MNLRDYQQLACDGVEYEWSAGSTYVMLVLPTGGGKTVTFCHIVKRHAGATIVLAHRAELIVQMSLALAREGIRHRIIGAKSLTKMCIKAHCKELGYSYYDATAMVAVASVQTVSSRQDDWFKHVSLWVHDEAHHLLRENQFGRAIAKFPNAKGLGVTATPGRTDGRGLGSHADGFFQKMIMGPTPRDLINRGFLSEYKIYCPPSNLKLDEVRHSSNGDFNPIDLKAATRKSTVLGDVVAHYAKHAAGKLGLTFSDSIENATTIAANFRKAGIPAEILTGKTPAEVRSNIIARFERREIMQIVSVSLIDEGFDCPAVEVVSDTAATESFNRFAQRFGRGLRVLKGKPYMIYFDHVGNVLRHGLPDSPRHWSLSRRDKRAAKDNDAIPIRICANTDCLQPYERFHKECPYCGYYPEPTMRSGPEFVDGDLTELDPAALAALRGSITRVDGDFYPPQGLDPHAQMAARNNHLARQQAQRQLRNAIAWYAGAEHARGYSQSDSYRRFYFRFGIDVANAQLLGSREAGELAARINTELSKVGVDGTRNWEEHIHY
jgi:DNA repair protein RadD